MFKVIGFSVSQGLSFSYNKSLACSPKAGNNKTSREWDASPKSAKAKPAPKVFRIQTRKELNFEEALDDEIDCQKEEEESTANTVKDVTANKTIYL